MFPIRHTLLKLLMFLIHHTLLKHRELIYPTLHPPLRRLITFQHPTSLLQLLPSLPMYRLLPLPQLPDFLTLQDTEVTTLMLSSLHTKVFILNIPFAITHKLNTINTFQS
jgi:hypothetical protein